MDQSLSHISINTVCSLICIIKKKNWIMTWLKWVSLVHCDMQHPECLPPNQPLQKTDPKNQTEDLSVKTEGYTWALVTINVIIVIKYQHSNIISNHKNERATRCHFFKYIISCEVNNYLTRNSAKLSHCLKIQQILKIAGCQEYLRISKELTDLLALCVKMSDTWTDY